MGSGVDDGGRVLEGDGGCVVLDEGRVLEGEGQTIPWHSRGQYSLILSCRYCCLSNERPGGVMMGGRSCDDGDQSLLSLFRRVNFFSGPSVSSLPIATPGLVWENLR